MRRLRAALAGAVLCTVPGATLLAARPASALSCAVPAAVAMDAEHVFAGTIVERRADHLVMAVSEVWWGGPVVERVRLPLYRGMDVWYPRVTGPHHRGSPTWVVATYDGLKVGPCSIWRTKDLRALRPADPAGPARSTPRRPSPAPGTGIRKALSSGHAPGAERVWAVDETSAVILGASLW